MNKVDRFEDLHIGDRVAIRPCSYCQKEHAGEIVGLLTTPAFVFTPDREGFTTTDCFKVMPPIPCIEGTLPWGIIPEMVEAGVIYADMVN